MHHFKLKKHSFTQKKKLGLKQFTPFMFGVVYDSDFNFKIKQIFTSYFGKEQIWLTVILSVKP